MPNLENVRVAVLATDGVEEVELTEPVAALKNAGANVEIMNLKRQPIQAFRHQDKAGEIAVDRAIEDANPSEYDALPKRSATLHSSV
jgi:protease I